MQVMVFLMIFFLAVQPSGAAVMNPRTNPDCQRISHVCVDKKSRVIAGQVVTRPCWRWRDQYQCLGASVDTCAQLVAKGCSQTGSACIAKDASGACLTYENTYQCVIKKGTITTKVVCGSTMCMNGNCFKASVPPSSDFAYVVSRFAAAAAAGASASASGGISIFKGTAEHCNRVVFGLKNCCKTRPKKTCPASAKKLGSARLAASAHLVGSWCPVKDPIFGTCLRVQQVWCVFPSKLARIIQEQGRPQLGIGWGAATSPICRGFTPAEFQRLDFSKMDLSEFYSDIMNRMTPMSASKLGNRIQNRMQNYYNAGAPNGGRVK